MKKKFSLRSQLVIIMIVFVVGILGITYLFQTTFLDDFYKNSKIYSLENVANKISKNINSNNLQDIIDEASLSSEVCVRVVSTNSKHNVIRACSLQSVDDQMINAIAQETVNNGGSKLFDNFKYKNSASETEDIYIYSKMIEENKEYTMILVSSIIAPLSTTISTIKYQYVFIAAVVIIMAILLALLLSRFLVKPIKAINDESKNLSKGKYNGSGSNFVSKEFSELNSTLANANEDILKADKAKKELLGNVSHDLRTPLTMIVGYGEMIRDIKEENTEENINVIIDEAKRLSTLVDDLIDISNFETNNVELHKENIKLNDLLNSVYHQYVKYCEEKNVEFELKLIDDIDVLIDQRRIKQVLYNFINNALNYNDKQNQQIILGCEIIDGKHRVYVYDNGQGISEENIEHIWDRYYKVDRQHKRHHIGSGIGLSLSKQLLQAHDLNFGVESKLGEYTKFYFDL